MLIKWEILVGGCKYKSLDIIVLPDFVQIFKIYFFDSINNFRGKANMLRNVIQGQVKYCN